MVDQLYTGTKPAGWAKEQLAADHLPRNSGFITAGEVERTNELIDCVAAMEREYRDALNYGDGNMPDWVKHRINPLDSRYTDAKPPVDDQLPAHVRQIVEDAERELDVERVHAAAMRQITEKGRAPYVPYQCARCHCDAHAVSTCPDPTCPIVEPTPSPAFHVLLEEIRAIHDAKNKDYADSEDKFKNFRECEKWGLAADYGCFTRMGDKMARLNNLVRREFLDSGGPAVADESIEDTAIDLAVYSLIYVLLRRERRAKGAK